MAVDCLVTLDSEELWFSEPIKEEQGEGGAISFLFPYPWGGPRRESVRSREIHSDHRIAGSNPGVTANDPEEQAYLGAAEVISSGLCGQDTLAYPGVHNYPCFRAPSR